MRIAFVAINYAPSIGGSQELVRRVAEGLVRRHGHDVTVVTSDAMHAPAGSDPGRIERPDEVIAGVQVERRPVARRWSTVRRTGRRVGLRLGRDYEPGPQAYGPHGLRFAGAVRREARRSDVVVGVSAPFTTIPLAERSTRGTSTAFVSVPLLHLGDWQPSDAVVAPLLRADRCVTQTDFERAWLADHGVGPDRMAVIPPGCDAEAFPHLDRAASRASLGLPDRPTVAFVGRLASHKGIDTVLAAFARVVEAFPDVSLLLAGQRTSWDLDAALDEGRSTWLDRVHVLEDFPESDKPVVFGAADVVLFPSREESYGIVTLESWAARRPVVVADVGAIGTVVRSAVDGVVVPVDDPDALAQAVVDLLRHPSRAARMGLAGRARVERDFTWDAIVDAWERVLHEAVAARRGEPSPSLAG